MSRKLWSENEDEYLRNHYEHLTSKEIAINLNRTISSIQHRASRLKLTREERIVNHSFFDNWSSDMAWVLGFWAADGCVSINGAVYISFWQKEKKVIEKVRSILSSTHKILHDKTKDEYVLSFASRKIYERLCTIFNMDVQRKSLVIQFPDISDEYIVDFIRGYVDGDGCLYWHYGAPRLEIASGSEKVIDGINDTIFRLIGIKGTSRKSKSIYVLQYDSIKAKCIAKWLYNNDGLSLSRKKELALNFKLWQPKNAWSNSVTPKMKELFSDILTGITLLKEWTKEEDVFVLLQDGLTGKEKAEKLNRNYNAVISRRYKLKHNLV